MCAQKTHLILLAADPNTKASMQQLNPPFERTTEARTGFSHSLKASLDRRDLIALAKVCPMQTGSVAAAHIALW